MHLLLAVAVSFALFASLALAADPRPWPPQYKIRPEEKQRLTAADVVGPDGIVYPNWTRCGVEGGIPDVKTVCHLKDFGGTPDGSDISAALDAACTAAGEKGGGAVLLGEGTFTLARPVTVRHDGVVLRGQGAEKTKIDFTYALPAEGIGFFTPADGGRVGYQTRIELHARPAGLQRVTIRLDGKYLLDWTRGAHAGNTFARWVGGWKALQIARSGTHTLTVEAEYKGGKKLQCSIRVVMDPKHKEADAPLPVSDGAITFLGGESGEKLLLARDGLRGETQLTLKSIKGLAAGDHLLIDAPATARWKRITQNACRWGTYRRNAYRIIAVRGHIVQINQPLRIDFPVIDVAWVRRISPVQRCGVEDLAIRQRRNLWITAVLFRNAWNCWARGVTVDKCGRFPVYGSQAKFCEIRDCLFNDAWFKGGGGTAYTGWDHSWDCLMEGVTTYKMRHGPLFQWSAAGNVIRKSTFHQSDGQWHAGWTNENLVEQCVIESNGRHGGYGYGLWASPPGDTAHGPNGPRNCVYNCDITSARDGLWMGGMNEGWLILHNRFRVARGPGVVARPYSFDHILSGNVFILKDGNSPMVRLEAANCVGIELLDNTLHGGNGRFSGGKGKPIRSEGNRALPYRKDAPRPKPDVPSIYQWQQHTRR